MFDYVPGAVFATPQRAKPSWRTVAPCDTEVYCVDEEHDVRVRSSKTGEDLGSLVRPFWLFHAFNPFVPFQLPTHTPRLTMGRVVVQRRTWRIRSEELESRGPKTRPRDVVVAVEALRARRGLPRWIYIRPVVQAGQRSSVTAMGKEVKPLCIDLESFLFIDVFMQRLERNIELEAVEMLPNPEQLIWRERDGRYCFELRTVYTAPRHRLS
jgi:hypothetical protein